MGLRTWESIEIEDAPQYDLPPSEFKSSSDHFMKCEISVRIRDIVAIAKLGSVSMGIFNGRKDVKEVNHGASIYSRGIPFGPLGNACLNLVKCHRR